MATPEAEGSEPADRSAGNAPDASGSGDPTTSGSSGASGSGLPLPGGPSSVVLKSLETPADATPPDAPDVVAEVKDTGLDDFLRLQRRLLWLTLCLAAIAVPVTALVFDRSTALSLAIGAAGALLYLRLLARSVSRLGENSRSVGKVQLLVPIVLVLAASRLPQLSILPVFLGFLLYKPAVIIQALTDA